MKQEITRKKFEEMPEETRRSIIEGGTLSALVVLENAQTYQIPREYTDYAEKKFQEQARNWLLKIPAMENLARLYETRGSKRSTIAIRQRLAFNPFNYDETRYRAYQELGKLYSELGCKWRSKLCRKIAERILVKHTTN